MVHDTDRLKTYFVCGLHKKNSNKAFTYRRKLIKKKYDTFCNIRMRENSMVFFTTNEIRIETV